MDRPSIKAQEQNAVWRFKFFFGAFFFREKCIIQGCIPNVKSPPAHIE